MLHKICFTVSLFHASTCFKHHVLIVRKSNIVPYSLWYHHTYSCDDTRDCMVQFLTSWRWAHGARNM